MKRIQKHVNIVVIGTYGVSNKYNKGNYCVQLFVRNGPTDDDPYGLSPHYWHVFAARLAFVVVFEVSQYHSDKQS